MDETFHNTFMAEILQGYWQTLDRSGKKIILLSPLQGSRMQYHSQDKLR